MGRLPLARSCWRECRSRRSLAVRHFAAVLGQHNVGPCAWAACLCRDHVGAGNSLPPPPSWPWRSSTAGVKASGAAAQRSRPAGLGSSPQHPGAQLTVGRHGMAMRWLAWSSVGAGMATYCGGAGRRPGQGWQLAARAASSGLSGLVVKSSGAGCSTARKTTQFCLNVKAIEQYLKPITAQPSGQHTSGLRVGSLPVQGPRRGWQ